MAPNISRLFPGYPYEVAPLAHSLEPHHILTAQQGKIVWQRGNAILGPSTPPLSTTKILEGIGPYLHLIGLEKVSTEVAWLAHGKHSRLYTLTRSGVVNYKAYVLKIMLPVWPHLKTASEAATIQFVNRFCPDISAPEIYAFDANLGRNELGFEWIIMDKLPGVPYKTLEETLSMSQKVDIAKTLADWHNTMVEVCQPFHQHCSLYMHQIVPPTVIQGPLGIINERDLFYIDQIVPRSILPPSGMAARNLRMTQLQNARLLHPGITPNNLFVDPTTGKPVGLCGWSRTTTQNPHFAPYYPPVLAVETYGWQLNNEELDAELNEISSDPVLAFTMDTEDEDRYVDDSLTSGPLLSISQIEEVNKARAHERHQKYAPINKIRLPEWNSKSPKTEERIFRERDEKKKNEISMMRQVYSTKRDDRQITRLRRRRAGRQYRAVSARIRTKKLPGPSNLRAVVCVHEIETESESESEDNDRRLRMPIVEGWSGSDGGVMLDGGFEENGYEDAGLDGEDHENDDGGEDDDLYNNHGEMDGVVYDQDHDEDDENVNEEQEEENRWAFSVSPNWQENEATEEARGDNLPSVLASLFTSGESEAVPARELREPREPTITDGNTAVSSTDSIIWYGEEEVL